MEKKNQLDATEWFIAPIIRLTCFGHFYAHHQELKTICMLLPPMVCSAWLLVVGGQEEGCCTTCNGLLHYNTLNKFRALLCPSSGAREYMCVITAYGAQCLVVGCRRSGAGQQGVRSGRGMLHDVQWFIAL